MLNLKRVYEYFAKTTRDGNVGVETKTYQSVLNLLTQDDCWYIVTLMILIMQIHVYSRGIVMTIEIFNSSLLGTVIQLIMN